MWIIRLGIFETTFFIWYGFKDVLFPSNRMMIPLVGFYAQKKDFPFHHKIQKGHFKPDRSFHLNAAQLGEGIHGTSWASMGQVL